MNSNQAIFRHNLNTTVAVLMSILNMLTKSDVTNNRSLILEHTRVSTANTLMANNEWKGDARLLLFRAFLMPQ